MTSSNDLSYCAARKKCPISIIGFIFVIVLLFSFFSFAHQVSANACESAATGNWSDAGTWSSCGGTTPQSADTVTILDTHVVTLNTNATVATTTIASGGTLTEDSNGRLLTLTTGWSNSGTFNPGTGTVRFGNINGTFVMVGNTTFNNLTINSGSNGARVVNLSSNTATTTGTLLFGNSSTGSIGLTGGGNLVALGDVYWNATSTSSTNTTVLTMAGTGAQTLTTFGAANTTGDFTPFVINKTSGTLTLSGAIRTRNHWTYTQGTLDASTNSTTITFASSITIAGSHTLYNVRFDNNSTSGSTYTISNTLTVAGTLSVDNTSTGDLVLGTGTIVALGDVNVDMPNIGSFGLTGSVIIAGSANQTFTGIDSTTSSGLFASTTVNKTGGTLTMVGVYRTGLIFNIAAGTVDWTTNDATLAFAASLSFNPGSTVYDNFYISSNTLTLSSSMTLAGNWTNAASFTSGANTVTFTGTGTSTVITGGTGTNQDFQNFTVNKSAGGVVQLSTNNLDVDGTLTISGGTLDLNGLNITTTTTCTNSSILKFLGTETLSCTPTNNSGSTIHFYGAGSATVSKAGSSIHHLVSSSNKTLVFPADTTTTIGGTMTLDGDSGSEILVKSSAAGTDGSKFGDTALISVAAVGAIDYVTAYDNDATGAATPIENTNSTDGGNTTGWDFGTPPDTTPPVISNIASDPDTTAAIITWTTDEAATSSVAYGVTSAYGATTSGSSYVTSHSVSLTGLSQDTTYHYRVSSRDSSGNISYSSDNTFTTVDANAPSVYLVAPVTGLTVFGPQVYLHATATDDSAVSIQFKRDTNTLIGSAITAPPYILTWDTTGLSGSHTVIAVARDAGGNYATSSVATVTVSNSGARVIPAGAGFGGATSQPAQAGTGTGADQKPVARWSTVPFQTFEDTINIGVVAFHMNRIQKVSFSANGGAWTDVTQMTRNPETNIVEYWATLDASDFSDGDVEVRAIVYPYAGVPRVLQGSFVEDEDNGVVSLFLSANSGGSLQDYPRYVATDGNNSTGNGTEGSPFLTIQAAIADVAADNGSADGALIYLKAGDYAAPNGEFTVTDRWVTVTSAPNVDPQDVRIVSQGRPKIALLRFYNLTLVPYTTTLFEGYVDNVERAIWIDRAAVLGPGRYETQTDVHNLYRVTVTESIWNDTANGPTGTYLTRNVSTETLQSDAFQNASFVVNAFVNDIDPSNSGAHPDFYQLYSPNESVENFILYNIDMRDMYAQGIFVGALPAGGNLDSMAIVDVIIRYVDPTNNPVEFSSQWSATSTGIYIRNVDSYDQTWLWRGDQLENFLVRDSRFESMAVEGVDDLDIIDLVAFSGNTIISSGDFDAFDTGADTTDPAVSAISSGTPGNTSATITWTTDEPSYTQVEYGLSSSYSASSTLDATMVTSHSVSLTGLSAGTEYHYRVISGDYSENEAQSSDQSFTTSGSSGDATAPSVSMTAPSDGATVSGASVTLTASASDNVAVVGVQFKLDTNTFVGSEDTSSPYSLSWDSTAVADGSHTLIAVARDASGNRATSTAITVTVSNSGGGDVTGPAFSNIGLAGIEKYSAIVTWDTDEAATSQVVYGLTSSYGSATAIDETLTTDHSVSLTGLSEDTTYHYAVVSEDSSGNSATSSDQTFTTDSSGGGGGGNNNNDDDEDEDNPLNDPNSPETQAATASLSQQIALLQAQLNALLGLSPNSVPAGTGDPVPAGTFTRDLDTGAKGNDVLSLQKYLNTHGFPVAISGDGALGQETTFFGPATQAALAKFQAANGITPAVGFFGPKTRALISSQAALSGPATSAGGENQPVAPTTPAVATSLSQALKAGSTGAQVTLLQQILNNQGYLTADNITGFFGSFTKDAVGKFQLAKGILSPNDPEYDELYGTVGPQTRAALNALLPL